MTAFHEMQRGRAECHRPAVPHSCLVAFFPTLPFLAYVSCSSSNANGTMPGVRKMILKVGGRS